MIGFTAQHLINHVAPKPQISQAPVEVVQKVQRMPSWTRDNFEEKINRVRMAKDEELTAHSIMIRNKTKLEYKDMFKELEVKYERDIGILQDQYEELKMIIFGKDMTISKMSSMLVDLQLLFTEIRYESKSNWSDGPSSPKNKITSQMIEDLKNLESQVHHLKEICQIYQEDTEQSKEKTIKAEREKEKQKITSDREIQKLKADIRKLDKEWHDRHRALETE